MTVLLAIGDTGLSDLLRKPLVESGFDVLQDEVLHRNYLNEFIEIQRPNIVIVHDVYLPSDFDEDKAKRDAEIVALIEDWRMRYDNNLRVVYLCVRDRKDPLLAKLVARNVLDIFYERSLKTGPFVEQLKEEPKFANVSRLGTDDLEFDFTEISREEEEDLPTLELEAKPEQVKKNSAAIKIAQSLQEGAKGLKGIAQKRAEAKETLNKVEVGIDESFFDEMLDIMPVERQAPPKPQIIGTVLIGVAGVAQHIGATHAAISIASYLKGNGHSVALVESNHSQDYDRIHSLYEGEKKLLLDYDMFEMKGLTHFKYREDRDLNDIFSSYEYVVMDFGSIFHATNTEEFTRAHVKCVVCSADEWKYHWIEEFENEYEIDNTYCYLVPGASMEKVEDLSDQLKGGDVVSFPIQDDPYEPIQEVGHVLTNILGEFIKIPVKSSTKHLLIGTSVGVGISLLVIMIFSILR
ncbi:hypothetical protein [Rummeliibacillus stabekisii]|uniref:hypothetical protein n=1 Tax=Rummeliibacillus stabekisii TaxID=241244 RepID=UPI0011693310|nr:hypothetical protein [Rummeliibacillus stabekisii]MBB5171584.1 hypothetical protein [Rummeliibacillus stabekisii]GEL05552.1 hypothetical protein RST01_21790 [Rummeliibacillus stabekisii]